MEFNWLDHIFVLVVMVIMPILSIKTKQSSEDIEYVVPPKKHLFYSNGLMLIIGALLILSSWNISGRSWVDLGMRWPELDFDLVYPVILVTALYLSDTVYSWMNKAYKENKIRELSFLVPLTWQEYGHYVFLAFAAGICEEIIFRGFLINYLQYYLSGYAYATLISITLPAIVFSLSHLYQGWWAVLKILAIAILFGWIFIVTKSLLIVIVLHIVIDLISGMVGIGMVEEEQL
jgi:membrane protease YdiL (CAAX protease family)